MGNAQDPLGYNNTTGVTGAVIVTIQSGGQFVETGAVHASITTLNMTGGTMADGPRQRRRQHCRQRRLERHVTSVRHQALIGATASGMNGGSFNVTAGPGAVDMLDHVGITA